jgi:hypothetical protein
VKHDASDEEVSEEEVKHDASDEEVSEEEVKHDASDEEETKKESEEEVKHDEEIIDIKILNNFEKEELSDEEKPKIFSFDDPFDFFVKNEKKNPYKHWF